MKRDHTKERIANSLKELSKTKALSEISIKDIVSASDINRSTFYYHFTDKDDLIKWIFKSDVVDYFLEAKPGEWTHNTYHLLCVLKRNNLFYKQAIKIDSANSLRKYLYEVNYTAIISFINNALKGRVLDKFHINFIASFYAHAFTETYIEYILRGAKETPEKMLQCYYDLSESNVLSAIDKFIGHSSGSGMHPML